MKTALLKVPSSIHLREPGGEAVEFATSESGGVKNRTYKAVAYTGVEARPGNWGGARVIIDLAGLEAASQVVPNFMGHDQERQVGQTSSVEITPRMVRAAGIVSNDDADRDVQKLKLRADEGFPWQMSVGVWPSSVVYVAKGESAIVNGRRFEGEGYIIRKGLLREISFCPLGADGNTSAVISASAEGESTVEALTMKFEDWLKSLGFTDAAAVPATQLPALQEAFKTFEAKTAAAGASAPPKAEAKSATALLEEDQLEDPVVAQRKRLAADLKEVDKIRTVCATYGHPKIKVMDAMVSLEAHALENAWNEDKVHLEALKASRPAGPAIHSRGPAEFTSENLEAAVCKSLRMQGFEKQFKEPTLEAADKICKLGIGLQWLVLQAARANGYFEPIGRFTNGNLRGVLRAAFPAYEGSSASTLSLPGIFANVMNKSILESWSAVEQTWRGISAVRSVSDFRPVKGYRLTGAMEYEKIGPNGEIKHGALGEMDYTNQAETYAKMFALTRTDLINDDLGALTRVPARLGRGAALKLNDVFWAEYLNNSAFFTTGNKNYYAHATLSLLDTSGLEKANTLFRDQTDPDGKPMAINPAILLVPNALEFTASRMMQSTTILQDGNGSAVSYGTANVFAGRFRILQSSYLSNSKYTGYSSKAWYLLANPADFPTIEVVFLNGLETPTIETAEADFDTLGVQIRGYHDFGVAKQEYRGGVKMKGEA